MKIPDSLVLNYQVLYLIKLNMHYCWLCENYQ